MFPRHRAVLFGALMLIAATASAQEFGRSSGGEVRMFAKQPSQLSATLGFRLGAGRGLEGTAGGTLIQDRMWFFASAMRTEDRFVATTMPQTPAPAIDGKIVTQLGASQMFSGSYSHVESTPLLTAPQSFLSLRYTGIISSNSFFSASVSSSR